MEDMVPDTMALPGSGLSTRMNNSNNDSTQTVFESGNRWDADKSETIGHYKPDQTGK